MTEVADDGVDPATIEQVATWLERVCRVGGLWQRAEIAAALRLGAWRDGEPRRRADSDVPPARAQAEAHVRSEMERARRVRSAREAVAAGVEPMFDGIGRPGRNASRRSYEAAADALGLLGAAGNPDAVRIYEYPADGSVEVYDGAGKLVERWPNGRRPRQNTRLAGHALRMVRCARCDDSHPGHPGCECGEKRLPDPARPHPFAWGAQTAARNWHGVHKEDVRSGRHVPRPQLRVVSDGGRAS